jgi:hypothetical protein
MKAEETTKSAALKATGRRENSRRGSGGRAIVAAHVLLAAGVARARLLDSVDVQPKGSSAEIVVRFATQVQYVRHAPRASGKTLHVHLQLTGPGADGRSISILVPSSSGG